MITTKPTDIDAYIAGFPHGTQLLLEQVRATIRKAAPDAQETISYAIPAFKMNGRSLVYFAGYKEHIGVYPIPKGDAGLDKQLSAYKAGKGTLRFPLDKKIPLELIAKVTTALMNANAAGARNRKK